MGILINPAFDDVYVTELFFSWNFRRWQILWRHETDAGVQTQLVVESLLAICDSSLNSGMETILEYITMLII